MKHIFLTGGTGVVGSAIVPRFLADPQNTVHLLVRAESSERLDERAAELWEYWRRCGENCAVASVRFYAGDVSLPKLGLSDVHYLRLTEITTHVVHCAGNVKLNQSLAAARVSAVDSAREIRDFARLCRQKGTLQKVDVVSTIGVAGSLPGLIPERRLQEPRAFRNTYEQSKAEAEELFWDEMEHGMPITIHRPSMVVGDSRTGRAIRPQVFQYIASFLTGQHTYGVLPRLDGASLDIVPSDYVARAIVASTYSSDAAGHVFHLCSGPEMELPLRSLADAARSVREINGERLPRLHLAPRLIFAALLTAAKPFASQSALRTWRNLPHFLAYLSTPQSFMAAETQRFFKSLGISLLAPEDYVGQILRFDFCPRLPYSKTS